MLVTLRRRALRAMACALILPGSVTGCSRSPLSMAGPNTPPVLEIVDARAPSAGADAIRVRWSARDPDGRLASIRWTTGPMQGERSPEARVAGVERECLVPALGGNALRARGEKPEPGLLTLWAVDDRGAASEPAKLAYFAQNVAPTVVLTSPVPSQFFTIQIGPSVCVSWAGNDPDGVFTQRPVKYKYTLLYDGSEFPINVALVDPDSLRRYYAPLNWAGWDSTSSETTFVRFTNLTTNQRYLFVVTAFDELGDYDPVFSLTKNMLYTTVGFPEALGPRMRVQMPGFSHEYVSGGWNDDPSQALHTEIAAGAPLTVQLFTNAGVGQAFTGLRWVLDPEDPTDETPRSGPNDLSHWSEWSVAPAIDLGVQGNASFKRQVHRLYFQARSGFGGCNGPEDDFVSKGLLEYVVVRATMSREILIVDDTRLLVDRVGTGGCIATYTGAWPSATELDTFLYARGGVPWRCTVNPSTGVLSSPGLFAGFAFDTLGTRGLKSGLAQADPGGPLQQMGSVPLSKLADYRHVIWLSERNGALNNDPFDSPLNPMNTLKHWSQTRQHGVLSAYARMGGKLWLVGLTATSASLPFDRPNNNTGSVLRLSSSPLFNELAEGRLPFDAAHVRSEVLSAQGAQVARALGRFESEPGIYGSLPAILDNRSTTFDPLPPTRTVTSQFNVSVRQVEGISVANSILEDVDPDPGVVNEQSVMDTLYNALGSSVPAPMPSMVVYHGSENGQVVWTGFDIWSFKRADCAALVNFVLRDLWGLTPSPQPGTQNAMAAGPKRASPSGALEPRTTRSRDR